MTSSDQRPARNNPILTGLGGEDQSVRIAIDLGVKLDIKGKSRQSRRFVPCDAAVSFRGLFLLTKINAVELR
jgi:hypothetical protein